MGRSKMPEGDLKLTDEEFTQISFVVQALQSINIVVEQSCHTGIM